MEQIPTETIEQQRLIKWADWCPMRWQSKQCGCIGDHLFAIPNGGSRRKRGGFSLEALRQKKEGLRAGVPDLMLAIPTEEYAGLFIEMKRAKKSLSRVSEEQKAWHEKLKNSGYCVVVAYGMEDAKSYILDYLGYCKRDAS